MKSGKRLIARWMLLSIATKRWKILRWRIQMSRRKFVIDIFVVIPKTWRTFVATAQACVSTHMDGSRMVKHIQNAKKKRGGESLSEPIQTHLYCQTPIPFHVSVPDNTSVFWLPLQYPMGDCQIWLYSTNTARRRRGVEYHSWTCTSTVDVCAFPVEGLGLWSGFRV